MKINVSFNPFEGIINVTIRDLHVLSNDIYKIAEIAENTVRENIERYLEIKNRGSEVCKRE